ncbi:hypothetical protein FB567DRAFT_148993 [Paraphoma chrysanthemicola]|uniref:Zn(2)-C6 fungal-type domain-containing protein n=1 Tax=Paraphoma chrysanthemicola TaxID=798071 RepID=A0A8K0VVB5_9PLEO|nr:hypothetical protein FB567DRAFT_148993 [Paraphoma chrysanthemicola]
MPPTRRKACVACIRTKRRCDQEQPQCRRCITNKRQCVYVGRTVSSNPESANEQVDHAVALADNEWQLQRLLDHSPSFSPCMSNVIFDYPNHPFNFPSTPDNIPFQTDVIQDLTTLQPSTLHLIGASSTASVQARVEHVVRRFTPIPSIFVSQAQTFFIHRHFFQTHAFPALQDVLSICALYTLKTPATQSFVFQTVQHKAQALIASTTPALLDTKDLVAATQALVLYQIIRLFDGDIRMRAQAELDEPILMSWIDHLRSIQCHTLLLASPDSPLTLDSTAPESPLDANSMSWDTYLLTESLNRTLITGYMLRGVYSFLCLGRDSPQNMSLRITLQTALWHAQSEVGWRRAGEEKERLGFNVTKWEEGMKKALPGDMEELGVLIMVMLWGKEKAGVWLGSRADEFGLGG